MNLSPGFNLFLYIIFLTELAFSSPLGALPPSWKSFQDKV
jgi:hypothetical protein